MKNQAAERDPTTENDWAAPGFSLWKQHIFLGYHCSDGQVETRNWIVGSYCLGV
jgi:hypothetical protein